MDQVRDSVDRMPLPENVTREEARSYKVIFDLFDKEKKGFVN